MNKYAKIINEETGLCEVGLGTNENFYKSVGMELMDVSQSDVDNQWYLSDLCPMKTEEEILIEAKSKKYDEANDGAKLFLESGEALYEFEEGKHIEATDGNIAKLTAYALAFVSGQLEPTDKVVWNTKEDETVNLSAEQVSEIITGIGQVQAFVWSKQFPYYVQCIENAQNVEEINAIKIQYSSEPEECEVADDIEF